MQTINVLYHFNTPELKYIDGYDKSVAIDLYTAEDVTLEAGEFALINLGVTIDFPKGTKGELRPRSSTFKKYGIVQVNSVGLIDSTYSGLEDVIMMPVQLSLTKQDIIDNNKQLLERTLNIVKSSLSGFINIDSVDLEQVANTTLRKVTISKNTRICQLEILPKMPEYEFKKVEREFWQVDKSRGGFGSTGTK